MAVFSSKRSTSYSIFGPPTWTPIIRRAPVQALLQTLAQRSSALRLRRFWRESFTARCCCFCDLKPSFCLGFFVGKMYNYNVIVSMFFSITPPLYVLPPQQYIYIYIYIYGIYICVYFHYPYITLRSIYVYIYIYIYVI